MNVMYIMHFANGANVSGLTKFDATPVGGAMAGIFEKSMLDDMISVKQFFWFFLAKKLRAQITKRVMIALDVFPRLL